MRSPGRGPIRRTDRVPVSVEFSVTIDPARGRTGRYIPPRASRTRAKGCSTQSASAVPTWLGLRPCFALCFPGARIVGWQTLRTARAGAAAAILAERTCGERHRFFLERERMIARTCNRFVSNRCICCDGAGVDVRLRLSRPLRDPRWVLRPSDVWPVPATSCTLPAEWPLLPRRTCTNRPSPN